jgi:hypothetical protein
MRRCRRGATRLFTDLMGSSSIETRLEFFKRKVDHSSADLLHDLGRGLLASKEDEFKNDVIKDRMNLPRWSLI